MSTKTVRNCLRSTWRMFKISIFCPFEKHFMTGTALYTSEILQYLALNKIVIAFTAKIIVIQRVLISTWISVINMRIRDVLLNCFVTVYKDSWADEWLFIRFIFLYIQNLCNEAWNLESSFDFSGCHTFCWSGHNVFHYLLVNFPNTENHFVPLQIIVLYSIFHVNICSVELILWYLIEMLTSHI